MSLGNSDSARHPLQGVAINLALLVAFVLLVVGLRAPILTLEKFYVFSNTVSLWSALVRLAELREWGLFVLIGGFSVAFPMLKILLLLTIWNWEAATTERHQQHLVWLATYSKWSMLDVFVVALLVVSVKLGALAEAHVEYGIYAFAASVIITMLVSDWVGKTSQGAHRSPP